MLIVFCPVVHWHIKLPKRYIKPIYSIALLTFFNLDVCILSILYTRIYWLYSWREKFRAQIQPHLLSSTIKIESCTLKKVYRATCWWGGWNFTVLTPTASQLHCFAQRRHFYASSPLKKLLHHHHG
jgi:hypothetical protein